MVDQSQFYRWPTMQSFMVRSVSNPCSCSRRLWEIIPFTALRLVRRTIHPRRGACWTIPAPRVAGLQFGSNGLVQAVLMVHSRTAVAHGHVTAVATHDARVKPLIATLFIARLFSKGRIRNSSFARLIPNRAGSMCKIGSCLIQVCECFRILRDFIPTNYDFLCLLCKCQHAHVVRI